MTESSWNQHTTFCPRRLRDASSWCLQEVVDQLPVALCFLAGPEHTCVVVNQAFLALTGKELRDVTNRTVQDIWPLLRGQGFFELLDTVYTTGEPLTAHEVPILCRNPMTHQVEERWLNLIYQPVQTENGTVIGIAHLAIDVTEYVVRHRLGGLLLRKQRASRVRQRGAG